MEATGGYLAIVKDQTGRTLWSLGNLMACIPDGYWEKAYCGMPLWKHLYHTLHSLDQWYINPFFYREPSFHTQGLCSLTEVTEGFVSRATLNKYFEEISRRILAHLEGLDDEKLLEKPVKCPYNRFHLIMAQHRHVDMHIGMLMGFIVTGKGLWPKALGIEEELPPRDGIPQYE